MTETSDVLYNKVGEDIKTAMKAQDKVRLNALRYMKSMLLENKTAKAPKAEMDIVIALHKKLKDGMEIYPEGHAEREKIRTEVTIIEEYMPKSLSEAEVKALIQDIKSKLSNPNMGMIMKELNPQIKGRFDGKLASQLVTDSLK